MRQELNYRVLVEALESHGQKLDEATRNIIKSAGENKEQLDMLFAALADKFQKQYIDGDAVAVERHEELMSKISHGPAIPHTSNPFIELQKRLSFQRQDDRYEAISDAHRETFEWAFEEPKSDQYSWSNLQSWLVNEDGIYWVSGKAGSGKSTFMKFLYNDRRLQHDALKAWAGDCTLLTASFFFWFHGWPLQRSQEGLFRSILLQVLDQAEHLGPLLFPKQYRTGANLNQPLSFYELRAAFAKLMTCLDDSHKLFLFIDGLDEFDAAQLSTSELAESLLEATKSPNIKAIVSSRPLSAFESRFAATPKLRLHELTQKSISMYVHDKLGMHERMIQLAQGDSTSAKYLQSEIVRSASGVFLWVELVVRSLIEGLENYDTLENLRQRLSELPTDLEKLFWHMLKSIPQQYKAESSRIFQLLLGVSNLTHDLLHLAQMDLDKVLQAKIMPGTVENVCSKEAVEGRLRSRCVGILELKYFPQDGCLESSWWYVWILHSTVADFLMTDDVKNHLLIQTAQSNFSPHIVILQAYVMLFKTQKLGILESGAISVRNSLVVLFIFVNKIDPRFGRTLCLLLEEFDRVMSERHIMENIYGDMFLCNEYYHDLPEDRYAEQERKNFNFLAFAVKMRMEVFITQKVQLYGVGVPQKPGRSLLHYACARSFPRVPDRLEMVSMLLKLGEDPNKECLVRLKEQEPDRGIWKWPAITTLEEPEAYAAEAVTWSSPWKSAIMRLEYDTGRWVAFIRLLLEHGADLGLQFTTQAGERICCDEIIKLHFHQLEQTGMKHLHCDDAEYAQMKVDMAAVLQMIENYNEQEQKDLATKTVRPTTETNNPFKKFRYNCKNRSIGK